MNEISKDNKIATIRRRALGVVLGVLVIGAAASGAAPKDRVTPAYDLFIGFLARCDCQPLNVQFRQLSIETVFRNLRFKFSPVTYGKKTYDWTLDSVGGPSLLMPVPGIMGTGDISDHDLCLFWDKDNHGKPLKATLARMESKIRPLIMALDRGRIPRIQRKILGDPAPEGESEDEDQVPLEPLVPLNTFVFEFTTNIEPGQTLITLEGSDAELRLNDIKCYIRIPFSELLEGKDVSREYPFRHYQVGSPGTLTVRFIPASKRR